VKPAANCDKSSRVRVHFDEKSNRVKVHFVRLALILAALLAFSPSLLAQTKDTQKTAPQKPSDTLWQTEDLPRDAVFRYGSTSRNPKAIGIYALRFSHDGKLLAARDKSQSIRVLDLENQELVAVLRNQTSLDFLISPDKQFVIASDRKQTRFWSIADREIVREVKKPGYKLALSANPTELVIVGKGTVSRYSWPLPSKPKDVSTKLNGRTVLPAGVSTDGGIAIFHNGGTVELLDTVTGELIEPAPKVVPKRAIVSPDGNLLAEINYGDSKLMIFDLRNAAKYQYVVKDKRRVVTAAFSNDSRFLYTSNYDNSIVIWDLVTMKQVDRVTGHKSRIHALASEPNKLLHLASGSSGTDRSVIFWDFRNRLFPPLKDPGEMDFQSIWEQLGSDDVKKSLAATNRLVHALQTETEVWNQLTENLGLNQPNGTAKASQLLKDLDDRKYEVREKATAGLRAMVEQIRPLLEQKMLEASQEAKWRISRILRIDKLKPDISSAPGRRRHRIVLALELCGSAEAVELLKRIVLESPSQPTVQSAKAALVRLSR